LKGSVGRVLIYGGARRSVKNVPIEDYVDSDFARCMDTRESLTGYVFNGYGIVVSWKVSLQKVVTSSTNKVEYIP